MSTVDKAFADNIVKHGGYYNGNSDNLLGDNPACVLIIQYTNMFRGVSYGLVFEGQHNKYYPQPSVINPEVYWKHPKLDWDPINGAFMLAK